jgi:hypothetical protein
LIGLTVNEFTDVLEQVENFFLIVTDWLWLGGMILSPAAVTGAQVDAEKLPVSTMPIDALCCLPGHFRPAE